MKIALANNLFSPYARGGAENVVARLAERLKADGHDVFIITLEPDRKEDRLEAADTDRVYRLPSRYYRLSRQSYLFRLVWQINNIAGAGQTKKLKEILEKEQPDLFLSHNLMGLGFKLPTLLRQLGIRHEHYLHDIQLLHPSGLMFYGQEGILESLGARLYQAATRKAFASPAKIVSPSRWLLAEHQKRGFFPGSMSEINSVDNCQDLRPLHSCRRFLFLGQLERHKGVALLIKAFSQAFSRNEEVSLEIVGGGSMEKELRTLAEKDQRISFRGQQAPSQAKSFLSDADCLVAPSLCYENSPTVIREAHDAKLPVIAAAIGGIPEMMTEADCLFRPGDPDDLAAKLYAAYQ